MKVTKTIREYIEKKVEEKALNSEHLLKLAHKNHEKHEQVNADIEAIKEKCKPFLQELADKYPDCMSVGMEPYIIVRGIHDYNSAEAKAYSEARREIYKKINDAVQEIIVEMEMGGTKAELMEKLDALKF
jgi:hypothetical protein